MPSVYIETTGRYNQRLNHRFRIGWDGFAAFADIFKPLILIEATRRTLVGVQNGLHTESKAKSNWVYEWCYPVSCDPNADRSFNDSISDSE